LSYMGVITWMQFELCGCNYVNAVWVTWVQLPECSLSYVGVITWMQFELWVQLPECSLSYVGVITWMQFELHGCNYVNAVWVMWVQLRECSLSYVGAITWMQFELLVTGYGICFPRTVHSLEKYDRNNLANSTIIVGFPSNFSR